MSRESRASAFRCRPHQQPLLGRNARGFRRLRLAPGPRPARHRLAPQLTALRPLRRRATGVAQKRQPGVGCSLAPSPVAPSPGRPTAHGELGCSPPPPRVPRRRTCPLPDARPAPERMFLAQTEQLRLTYSYEIRCESHKVTVTSMGRSKYSHTIHYDWCN